MSTDLNELINSIKKESNNILLAKEKIWNELMSEYDIISDISFNESNVDQLLKKKEWIHLRYYGKLIDEKAKLEVLLDKLNDLKGEIYDNLRFNSDKNLAKQEIEKYYIERDVKVKTLKRLYVYQKFRVEFFEMCINNINNLGWTIKEFLTTLQKAI